MKIKKSYPTQILFVFFILFFTLFFAGGNVLWASPASPVASLVSIDSGADSVVLNTGTTKNVVCTATVTDDEGYEDIVSVEAKLYRTGVGVGASDDNNNHYTVSGDSQCVPSNGSGTTEDYTCTIAAYYYADPTDTGSIYEDDNWTCQVTPSDVGGPGTADTDTIEMDTLMGLSLSTDTISYGTMDLGTNTGVNNQDVNIINEGNVRIDVQFDGYGTIDGDGKAMVCNPGSILIGNEKYDIDESPTADYDDLAFQLTDTAVERDWDILQRTNDSSQEQGVDKKWIYWGLAIPAEEVGGSCSGYVTFTAVNDAEAD